MPLLDVIQKDMVRAMKSKDEVRLSTARMIKTALTRYKVDSGKPLDEAAEQRILASLVKQRQEAIEMFRKGGREEMAAKEEAEMAVIRTYMPEEATVEQMDAAVEAAVAESGASSMKDMGAVMKLAKEKLAGKTVDGKLLSDRVKGRLG